MTYYTFMDFLFFALLGASFILPREPLLKCVMAIASILIWMMIARAHDGA